MNTLLSLMKRDVSVVQLTSSDRKRRSDSFESFRELVLANQPAYPRIENWLRRRVVTELGGRSRRMAFLAYEEEKPVGSAVLKLGKRAKICHLNVTGNHSGKNLGDLLFSLMLAQAASVARSVHFTLPETLWNEKGGFFQSFGFIGAEPAKRQYRHGEEELACSADFSIVWQSLLGKLPRLVDAFSVGGSSVKPSLMLSVRPRFADLILKGKKRIEIRTRFSERWVGHRISIYASSPVRCVVGEAAIKSVSFSEAEEIWQRHREELGCSREEYARYVGNHRRVYAIELGEVFPYQTLVPFHELDSEKPSPPQAYCRLLEGAPLTRAAMAASLVHHVGPRRPSGPPASLISYTDGKEGRTRATKKR